MLKKKSRFHGRKITSKEIIENTGSPFIGINEASIDPDNFIIKGACLFGTRESANNRNYKDRAIQSITDLSEGVKCYINHPTKSEIKERDGVRDLRDWAGVYRNARREGVKVFADLHVREEYFELVQDIALMQPNNVGNSINARVKVFQDETGMESVADIDTLRSVDLVSNAATTSNLFESTIEEVLKDELLAIPDILQELVETKFELIMAKEGVIQDKIDDQKVRREIDDLNWSARDLIFEVLNDKEMDISKKKDKIGEILDDLDNEITSKMKGIKTGDGDGDPKEKTEAKENMDITLEILKAEHSDLIAQLFEEFKAAEDVEKTKTDLKSAKEKAEALEDSLKEKDEAIKTANEKIDSLESEVKDLKKKLDDYEVKDKVAEKKEKVDKAISEAKISKEYLSDIFYETLMAVEEKGDDDGSTITVEEQVKKLLDDRKKIINSNGKIKGAGEEFVDRMESEGDDGDGKSREEASENFLKKAKKK